jgi:hypothetical protein
LVIGVSPDRFADDVVAAMLFQQLALPIEKIVTLSPQKTNAAISLSRPRHLQQLVTT